MNTYKLWLLFALFLSIGQTTYAQGGNSSQGYVVLMNGDTLMGQIKVESAFAHAQYVSYRSQSTESWEKYYPDQLSAYYFGPSSSYTSESIPFRTNTSDLNYRQLFVKKLIVGAIELYRLDYELRERISPVYEFESTFYFFKDISSEELIDLLPIDYKSKINNALGSPGCNFNDLGSFGDEGLKNLFIAYSDCRNLGLERVSTEKKLKKLQWGISLGLASAEVNVNNSENRGFSSGSEIGFDISAFISPQLSQSLNLRIGIMYKNRVHRGSSSEIVPNTFVNAGDVLNLNSSLDINQIVVPAHLIFSHSLGRMRPYLLAGVGIGFSLNNTYAFQETRFTTVGGETTLFVEDINAEITQSNLNALEVSWNLGLGGAFKLKGGNHIFLELLYGHSSSNDSSDSPSFVSQRGFSLVIGYGFD
ncbi:MAG: outer membrane beta-barrel protein [Bacteroidota bacterium]